MTLQFSKIDFTTPNLKQVFLSPDATEVSFG